MLAGNYFSKHKPLEPSNRAELIVSLIFASRISKEYSKHLNKELRASNKKWLQQVLAMLSKTGSMSLEYSPDHKFIKSYQNKSHWESFLKYNLPNFKVLLAWIANYFQIKKQNNKEQIRIFLCLITTALSTVTQFRILPIHTKSKLHWTLRHWSTQSKKIDYPDFKFR